MAQRKKAPTRARKAATPEGRAKQAKAASAAEGKAKHTATITALQPVAKEVNHRFEQAAKMDGKADDHRLAAAIKLAEAKARCEQDKLNFRKWVKEHVEQSFETVRKLAVVGASDEPAKALADMRGKNKDANRKARAKASTAKAKGETVETYQATKPATPFEEAEDALDVLDDKTRLNLVTTAASALGMRVVSEQLAKEVHEHNKKQKKAAALDLGTLKKAFTDLKPAEKMEFVEFAADVIGAKVDLPFTEDNDGMDIPKSLKR